MIHLLRFACSFFFFSAVFKQTWDVALLNLLLLTGKSTRDFRPRRILESVSFAWTVTMTKRS